MKRSLLLLLFCLFVSVSCNKKQTTAPPPKPENYFICNVNDVYFQAGCDGLFSNCLRAELDTHKGEFILSCRNNSHQTVSIFLIDSNGLNINAGSFSLSGGKAYRNNVANYSDQSYQYGYHTDTLHVGVLNVSFDLEKKRATGTFSFIARHDLDSNETINVSKGKFSVDCQID